MLLTYPNTRKAFGQILACLAWACWLASFAQAQQAPDAIYFNGKFITMSGKQATAEAVAIVGDRFQAIGTTAEVLRTASPQTRKIDLAGKTVVPGLIESHVHPISAALSEIDGAVPVFRTIPEIQSYIREQSAKLPASRVIFVPKIYSTRLQEHRYPTRQELDAAAPGREAMVDNGYASVLNSALLQRLGITRDTPQPENGRIAKDEKGELTGLIMGAPDLLGELRASRPVTAQERRWALEKMQAAYNRVGITSIIDRLQGPEGFRTYQALHQEGKLTVRSYVTYLVQAKGSPADVRREIEALPFVTGWGDKWLRVGSLKTVVDGGILIGTAYLQEPYGPETHVYGFIEPEYRGVLAVPRENVFEMAKVANELGWQMTAHTTGGGATELLLDAYEAANQVSSIKDRRFTVTHGNFVDAKMMERARNLGVVFDVQPAWMQLDGEVIRGVLGSRRMKQFQPLRSMLDQGLVIAGGSDHMIRFDSRLATNPYHPFLGMWAAVTRKTVDGTVLNPEQRISRMEALKMWTWNGAYLSFAEKDTGSIEPGKLADMVVVSKDFVSCSEDEIRNIEPLQTIVGGKVVYEAK